MPHQSTKTYGHEVGLSVVFRQWRAQSHCNMLHGYAISVGLKFEAKILDSNGWVVDFGGLKEVKAWLQDTFDHTLLVASDDPQIEQLKGLHATGLANVIEVRQTGCEAFARMIFEHVEDWLTVKYKSRCYLVSVEVKEHGANSAIYSRG